jgi:biotin synthase
VNKTGIKKEDVLEMLSARGAAQRALFERARRVRNAHFGGRAVVRGVIEITNLCRVNCSYCPMRRDNTKDNNTFYLGMDEIIGAAREIRAHGIGVVFFQGGEVPQTTKLLAEAIPRVKDLFNGEVEVLLNIGIKSRGEYALLRKAGADSAILKYETSDEDLHLRHREEPLERRMDCIRTLQALGYRVGSGTIIGLPGQTLGSLADDVLLSQALGLDMSSSSPFQPAPGTPLVDASPGDFDTSLNTIAAMRVALPGALIPSVSALEALRPGGQLQGLNAGGNVLTINFTPKSQSKDYLIYGKNRYLVKARHVKSLLAEAGLESSLREV